MYDCVIKTASLVSDNSVLKVNFAPSGRGKTILALTSTQSGPGDRTGSYIHILWCGYDGNNFHSELISKYAPSVDKPPVFDVNATGNITVKITEGTGTITGKIRFIINRT